MTKKAKLKTEGWQRNKRTWRKLCELKGCEARKVTNEVKNEKESLKEKIWKNDVFSYGSLQCMNEIMNL